MPDGSWAIPVIHSQNPDFEVQGTFPFQQMKQVKKSNDWRRGDLALSVSATSQHKEESQTFCRIYDNT